MDIKSNWKLIREHFNQSFRSNFHVAIASVDASNNPTVTPIGSVFLNGDRTGFYFEKFPSKLPLHARANKNICILGVNSNRWFWIKSLFLGKFKTPPAIKLYGELGEKRKATHIELSRLERRVRIAKGTRGHAYLWKGLDHVREINFTKAEKINLAKMTEDL